MDLKLLCEKYKLLVIEADRLEKLKIKHKDMLLEMVKDSYIDGVFEQYDVKITQVHQEPSIDTKALVEHLKLTPDQIAPFLKERKMQHRIQTPRVFVITRTITELKQEWGI